MILLRYDTLGLAGPSRAGATLHEAVRDLGHVIDLSCGGQAICSTCCVLVVEGEEWLEPPRAPELAQLSRSGLAPPWRLSCQAALLPGEGEVTIVAC